MRIALPAAISAAAVAACDPAAAVTDLGGETMGTRWSVRAVLPAGVAAIALRTAVVARLDTIVAEMSHWLPASLLSRFNRAPAGSAMVLPPDFAEVMARGLAIAEATGGAFDPAIGRLVDLWGFGPVPAPAAPDAAALEAARAASGWRRLGWSAGDRRLSQPGGVALDLSGIAKGFAVDAVAATLARLGVGHALVEIGGELVGRGVRPDGQPWWVDLETPPGIDVAPLRIALHGLAVATSGDYRRGRHTIDPRTGRSTDNGVVSVSVIAADALTADAWATALTVLGPDAGIALATQQGIAARIVVAAGGERLTPALAAMLAD
ncbi:FAD:protein FMN transferase [Sphingomonas sp. CD22]|uniref:FAD:protein FMN transferase n=1 Tax=Sphingomonas sp. CD22 TaxID=3100214 RepID=UPI002ADFE6CE|nr:FAD:protein FMN transferase [Sphingomonas sp. CD22]MEA1082686.1 FAD:protein FMN transferase [Sphingomonas sp. CD22]